MIRAEDNITLVSNKATHDIASDTAQFFWVEETGTDTGVHITEVTKDEFLADPSGGNLLARSNGLAVRDGLEEVATFGADGVTIGLPADYHAKLNSDAFYISSGYENLFAVDKSDRSKAITSVDVEKVGRFVSADTAERSGSFIAHLNTTYLFSLNSSENTTTYNSSTDGTNTTKTLSYVKEHYRNDVTLVFTPAVDSEGTACVLCEWTQVFTRTSGVSGGFATFTATHDAVIVAPKMNFEGDVRINGYLNVIDGYENLFKITSVPVETGSISADSYKQGENYTMTEEAGYNAVGIVGWSTTNWRIQPTSHYINSNTQLFSGFANYKAPPASGTVPTASATITFRVLWLKATQA